MKASIEYVAEMIKWEADEYRKKYDVIQETRKREAKEAREKYKPGSKFLSDKLEEIESTCDSTLARLKIESANRVMEDVENLRQWEALRVQKIDESLLAKVHAIENIPMSSIELKTFFSKINTKNDYWCNRAIYNLCSKWGIDTAEVGLEPSLGAKMDILNGLVFQFNEILKNYGSIDRIDRQKTRFLYLSDEIVARSIQTYNGKIGRENTEQAANKAYITIAAQVTDIEKAVVISNILRNSKPEMKNEILCKLSLDNNISDMTLELSGYAEEVYEFKNGKAEEYAQAKKTVESIRKMKDKTVIEQTAAGLEENTFFRDMYAKEQKTNIVLYETLHGEIGQSESTTE